MQDDTTLTTLLITVETMVLTVIGTKWRHPESADDIN
jgi:hypothetical protein